MRTHDWPNFVRRGAGASWVSAACVGVSRTLFSVRHLEGLFCSSWGRSKSPSAWWTISSPESRTERLIPISILWGRSRTVQLRGVLGKGGRTEAVWGWLVVRQARCGSGTVNLPVGVWTFKVDM